MAQQAQAEVNVDQEAEMMDQGQQDLQPAPEVAQQAQAEVNVDQGAAAGAAAAGAAGTQEPDGLNYQFIKGQGKDTQLLSFRGKLYTKDRPGPGHKVYYRCRRRRQCMARGYILQSTFHPNLDVEHSAR